MVMNEREKAFIFFWKQILIFCWGGCGSQECYLDDQNRRKGREWSY
jgi:hypothetical protein